MARHRELREARRLDAERMEADLIPRQRADDDRSRHRIHSSTHRTHADDGLLGEVDAGADVVIDVSVVAANAPPLQDGSPRKVGSDGLELEVARQGPRLVRILREPRRPHHFRLTHPILDGGPLKVANLVAVPAYLLSVVSGREGPSPMERQLAEAAAVKDPGDARAWKTSTGEEPTT